MIRSIHAFGVLAVGLMIASQAVAGQGNGLPPGPHFMLNVIAFDAGHCPAGDFTDSNRHEIVRRTSRPTAPATSAAPKRGPTRTSSSRTTPSS